MQKRINTILIAAVVSALTVAGLAIAQGDGGGSGEGGKSKSGQRPPGPPPGGPGALGGPGPGGPGGGKALTYSETHLRRNGKDVVVRVDKGKVVSASDDSIEIERNDGESVTIAVDDDTKVLAGPRKRGADAGDIAAGKQVVVVREDGDAAAEAISIVPKNPPRGKVRHRFGPLPGGDRPAPPSLDGGDDGNDG